MTGLNPGSPTDFQYFYEDEVYKINNSGQVVFGLVFDNYEANSSDQDSDVETPIQKGEVRVVWHPSGTERVVSERTVGLADRSLMPGDVVRRLVAGKDTQRGYCRDIVMKADLQIVGTKHVIPCVASERLQPLEEFTPDLAVCLESWVGTTKAVQSKLRLVSPDGSRLEYPDLENCPLEDYSMRRSQFSPYSSAEFYPGQVVYGPLGALDNANWLHMTKEMKAARKHKMHEHKFTVEAVITDGVGVHWQCRALSTHPADATPQQPKYLVEGEDLKNLKLLNVFEPCTLQVGDRNFLTISENDTFINKKLWRKQQSKYYRNLRKLWPSKKSDVKSETKSEHVPSRPKKRAASRRKPRFIDHDMEIDSVDERMESLDDTLKADSGCPSIRIESSALLTQSSQEDAAAEEKNDSGISPEPAKEDTSLVNGDVKSLSHAPVVEDSKVSPGGPVDDDSDNWENTSSECSDTDSGATWSSRCSSAASGRGKRSPQLAVRLLRGKRLKRTARRQPAPPPPRPADRLVVETLHTHSVANVVWQDGSIELNIPSTELYPIHHLDGQECFPGDFVVSGAPNTEEDTQLKRREYGVVQRVDHHGRTAIVHWYRTYTTGEEPIPQMLSETEVSVYDLKDHPDFQYRPGTVVIRIANFTGDDVTCTAGQVIDNYPSGRVKVWWVDGHTSMCWPQDLYKVGEYDEDGDPWGSDSSLSDDSWETQSSLYDAERAAPAPTLTPAATLDPPSNQDTITTAPTVNPSRPLTVPRLLEPKVASHIERGRVAMRKLEEIFAKNPGLQSQEIMRKLLNLYKDCRFLDRLMGTSFFHEDHFLGLLERVRERGAGGGGGAGAGAGAGGNTPSAGERRVHDQLTRLFTPSSDTLPSDMEPEFPKAEESTPELNSSATIEAASPIASEQAPRRPMEAIVEFMEMMSKKFDTEIINNSSLEHDCSTTSDVHPQSSAAGKSDVAASSEQLNEGIKKEMPQPMASERSICRPITPTVEPMEVDCSTPKKQLHLDIDAAQAQPSSASSKTITICNADSDSVSCPSGADAADLKSHNVCYKLCSLIHSQLKKAHAEVNRRRPVELVDFLNEIMKKKFANSEELTYHFSIQYGELVINKKNIEKTEEDTGHRPVPEEPKPVESLVSVEVVPDTAPLALAEVTEVEEPPLPPTPPSPCPEGEEGFSVLESAPEHHRFRVSMLQPSEPKTFYAAVKREIKLMKSDLPPGVWVRGYEDRIDLLSVMIAGPKKTPYEDGLFLFDVQLGGEYPRAPPLCHYHSYCNDRLNPNLYEDGKVCVSLLGTWSGRGVEVWGKDSSLLQVIVSLQGLILNAEPYFNEAGYEKQKGTQEGNENSRMYNEMVLLKLVQSMTRMLKTPPEPFREEIVQYCRDHGASMCNRLEGWVTLSNAQTNPDSQQTKPITPPDFPLIPASRGFCLTLRSSLEAYRTILKRNDIPVPPSVL